MSEKILDVFISRPVWLPEVWRYQNPDAALTALFAEMKAELTGYSIQLRTVKTDLSVEIRGYGDLLNSFRLSCPAAGVGSLCLGHIIGASPNRQIVEDLRRGINRVAFAPETIEPQGSDKVVCHNCGCGC
ncbi:MAG TPA: hypothetical protein VIR78_06050 [Malonomonas sp.]